MKVVIMAGGKGSRFWPRSSDEKPKQFLSLTSEETMLQSTYRRFAGQVDRDGIYIATVQKYVPLVQEQLPELDPLRLIVEPEQKDTGPSIALTALRFLQEGMDEPFVTVPSDHFVGDDEALIKALRAAVELARDDHAIVTLGVVPTRAETGYGYLKTEQHQDGVHKVKAFIEKPDAARAEQLAGMPHVYWNCGIFVWKPSTVAHYMKLHAPEMWKLLEDHVNDPESVYPGLQKISVDYAILEKADQIYCIPAQFEWDDVGSWTALERLFHSDKEGNIAHGPIHIDRSNGNIVYSETQNVIMIGVRDLIVVSTSKGVLVCAKSEEQTLKKMLEALNGSEFPS
ncbi:mannose-1-phosphate guanylyltransferase [Paenibacillus thalictri]|uniref:Mannose-1-phosphate guanylyltransferase n=1 Tax=Paenibacillus thalictri TaxID=2527873 RepID=A0A4Q9E0I7_9BACL|nr:sugar phosphate nucleotidyltransferase [Paenibacillus thalictri]TBL81748.1 mannose-1-phosphate guanylyltransferase [Paenibacillus thalictri]